MANQLDADIGRLIVAMNPYTDGSEGSMDPHTFVGASSSLPPSDMKEVWMEIDSNYPATWSFKGQEQKINTAMRIAYRYMKTVSGQCVWVTDYLLIGYEGSGAG